MDALVAVLDRRGLARTDQRCLAVRAAGRGCDMSQITEQEAREAAAFIADIGNGANEHAPKLLAALMMNILSRRDAERAERALPITAEWCLANGAAWNNHRAVAWWRILDNARLEFNAANGVAMIVGDGWSYFDNITTRGQLLDLLRALRGGAT